MVRLLATSIVVALACPACTALIDNACDAEDDICPSGHRCVEEEGACVPGLPHEWVPIRAGTFMMGSPVGEAGRFDEIETQHSVTLTRDFEIMTTEVTQEEFEALMGFNPSEFGPDREAPCGPDCPVERVCWHHAAAWCNAMSDSRGLPRCYVCTGEGEGVACSPDRTLVSPYECLGYRLPTEAEWEYAARAGDPRATYAGELDPDLVEDCDRPNAVLDPIAWWAGNAGWPLTHAVGSLLPNAWSLYDMLGSVQEWCHDHVTWSDFGEESVVDPWVNDGSGSAPVRAGGWAAEPRRCRAAFRDFNDLAMQEAYIGFRAVRTLP